MTSRASRVPLEAREAVLRASRVPFDERGGMLRGALDLVCGRFPRFVFGGALDPARTLPVFHFHDVTREDLEPKLRHLAENGYRTLTADEIWAYVRRDRGPASGPAVALCFDDAWASVWSVAGPLLKKYGLTGIVYAIPGRMVDAAQCRPTHPAPGTQDGTRNQITARGGPPPLTSLAPSRSLEPQALAPGTSGSPFVTWPELRALHESGVLDVQCHTAFHAMIVCSRRIRGFVTPEYARTPLLNRPMRVPGRPPQFLTPEELGAPLYVTRSRMSDGPRVEVPQALDAWLVDYVAREGGVVFFTRTDWLKRLHEQVRNQVRDLAKSAGGNGSAGPGQRETEAEQQRAIEEELDRGRSMLNQRLHTTSVRHACLPWGVSGRLAGAALARLGYRTAFANRLPGVHAVRPGDDPYWLKRLPNRYILRLPGRGRWIWG